MANTDYNLSYEKIFEILRAERKNEKEIKELPPNFIYEAAKYIKIKRENLQEFKKVATPEEYEARKETIADMQRDITNTLRNLRELFEKRLTKIINYAVLSKDLSEKFPIPELIEEETKLYEQLTELFRQHLTILLKQVNGE